jgi:drug/metabolite transporter (DMT)-like permease
MGLPMAMMTLTLEDLPVGISGRIMAPIPLATIASAHFLVEGEKFRARALPGLLVALAGSEVLVGVGAEGVNGGWKSVAGVTLLATGVLLADLGGALSRRFALEVSSDDLVLPQFTVATWILFTLMPLLGTGNIGSWSASDWVLIGLLGAIGTTLPFTSFLIAGSVNPASRLGLPGYSTPVLAVVLAVIFLGEVITPAIAVGAALIVGGVVLTNDRTRTSPNPVWPHPPS